MRRLSKSKLLAFRQCPKRLWLEIYRPELKEEDAQTSTLFAQGNEVGAVARRLYDPLGTGTTLNPQQEGWPQAFERTRKLLLGKSPIFEACLQADGVVVLADVMLPARRRNRKAWRIVEVKSSTHLKAYHADDLAIQAHVAQASGVALSGIALATVNGYGRWTYRGDGNYDGFLDETDLTEDILAMAEEVQSWIRGAKSIVRRRHAPEVEMSKHCSKPFACSFINHCSVTKNAVEFPVQWLPRVQTNALKGHLQRSTHQDMRAVPDVLLNEIQLRVKQHTLAGTEYFNRAGAQAALKAQGAHKPPLYFLDFETVALAVPRWKGTRPYQPIVFQFACHHLTKNSLLEFCEFFDFSGKDPSDQMAEMLVNACGVKGAVLAYKAGFERERLKELAARVPKWRERLLAISERVVDLLPIAEKHYYHPRQEGSWSLKKILPPIAPDFHYGHLEGVKEGASASAAYIEAIDPTTSPERKEAIALELRTYCKLDTMAMVQLWLAFSGRAKRRSVIKHKP